MTNAAIATDFHQSLDIETDFSFEVAFDVQMLFDVITNETDLIFTQILDANIGIDAGLFQNLLRSCKADTIDVGKSVFNSLVARKIHAGDSCHFLPPK